MYSCVFVKGFMLEIFIILGLVGIEQIGCASFNRHHHHHLIPHISPSLRFARRLMECHWRGPVCQIHGHN